MKLISEWLVLWITWSVIRASSQIINNSIDDDSMPNGLENSPLDEVVGVVGEQTLLPCDIDPPISNDSTHLVLFYRSPGGTPIYSLDARSVSLDAARHWAETEIGDRAYMTLGKGPKGLILEKLTLADEGEYRCRVDFLESPTRNSRVRLKIIVPPTSLRISSDLESDLSVSGMVGPYAEGTRLSLSCHVMGGSPRPEVTWWHEGSLLDDISEVKTGQLTRNALVFHSLNKQDLYKTLTCQASNSDLVAPISARVTIDMAFPPQWVRVDDGYGHVTMAEGITRRLTCVAHGSRPPATITWWRGADPLLGHQEIREVNGNISSSTLLFTPEAADDGAVLTCTASSPSLPDEAISNSTKLSVLYKPRLRLQLGADLALDDLEEGDDIHFMCEVDSKPVVTGVQWAHNGVPLHNDPLDGVSLSKSSLTRTSVSRKESGAYTCAAANSEGSSTSNTIQLGIKYLPTCVESQQTVYGAARHEDLLVPCRVSAHPSPTSFRWAMNSSTGLVDLALNLYNSTGRASILRYTPKTHHDFGDLLCWAINDLGLQKDPCVFSIIPAAKPEAVSGCVAERNSTMPASYLVVSCVPGWNGGLNQSFTLEVRQAAHEVVLDEFRHAAEPFFIITGVKLGIEYTLTVTAANSRGSSPPTTISYTARAASADKVVSPHSHNLLLTLAPFLVLLMGVLVAVSACVGVGVIMARKGRQRKNGAQILYAGPLKDTHDAHDAHTLICVNKDCEKEELHQMPEKKGSPGSFYVNPGSLLNNSGGLGAQETDVLLRDRLAPMNGMATMVGRAPLASTDSLGRYSTHSSICTTSSKTSRSSRASSSTVALNPDYLAREEAAAAAAAAAAVAGDSACTPLVALPKESSV
ncbi:hemicentin-2-like isoform X1 [Macrobrachium nipponense]|uniref:hemicentin-2-like isoform X1 n=1 Tax=Macrobrachium nipponense TaxID=159736 RepID=UPI0030C7C999